MKNTKRLLGKHLSIVLEQPMEWLIQRFEGQALQNYDSLLCEERMQLGEKIIVLAYRQK